MQQERAKRYAFFVGADVSKNKLDFAVMRGKTLLFHREVQNDATSIRYFIVELKQLPKFTIAKAVFCMEHTGIYCNALIEQLKRLRANIVVENPIQIKNSLGTMRGKYDKVDSIRIADYAYTYREDLRLYTHRRPIIEQLAQLNALRNRLCVLRQQLKTPLNEQMGYVKKELASQNMRLCAGTVMAIQRDICAIESEIAFLVDSDQEVRRLMELVTSVHCIGPVTALHVILTTNEFKGIRDPKKFACYSGVAPFVRNSGTFKTKARVSHLANKKMKALLHFCALTAKARSPELKAYFERKTQMEGKAKLAVINAIRYKLILRIFACVNQNRLYRKEYLRLS